MVVVIRRSGGEGLDHPVLMIRVIRERRVGSVRLTGVGCGLVMVMVVMVMVIVMW